MGLFTLDKDLLPESWKKSGPSGKLVLREPPEVGSKEPVYLVTDTSWWMEQGWRDAVEITETSPNILFVIPAGTMRELDRLKHNESKAERAREAIKQILELIQKKKAKIVKGKNSIEGFLSSPIDEEVLSVAKNLKKRAETVLLTTDYAMMVIAENEGIKSQKKWKTIISVNDESFKEERSSSYYAIPLILSVLLFFIGLIASSLRLVFLAMIAIVISFAKWWTASSPQTGVTVDGNKQLVQFTFIQDKEGDDIFEDMISGTSIRSTSGFDPTNMD